MTTSNNIIDILRTSRGSDDVLDRLREGTLEARRAKLAEAASDAEWEYGPAELVYTYEQHVLVSKDGSLVRAAINEDEDGNITFTDAKMFESQTPVNDIAYEVMETAREAARSIMDEDFDSAAPMLGSIVRSIDVKGGLQRRLQIEVALRGLDRDPWYSKLFTETVNTAEALPYGLFIVNEDIEGTRVAVDSMINLFKESLNESLIALKQNEDTEINKNLETFAQDLIEDVKLVVGTLQALDRDNQSELASVYEALAKVGGKYLSGLKHLTNSMAIDNTAGNEKE